jgi:hypothetical protein
MFMIGLVFREQSPFSKVFEGLWKLAHGVQRVSVVVQGGNAQEEDEGLRREVFKRSFAYQILSKLLSIFGSYSGASKRSHEEAVLEPLSGMLPGR